MSQLQDIVDLYLLQIICESVARLSGISCVVMSSDGKRLIRPHNVSVICGGDRQLRKPPTCFREVADPDPDRPNQALCTRCDSGGSGRSMIVSSRDEAPHENRDAWCNGSWEVYRCHAGIVDLSVPMYYPDGVEIARFTGGQVIFNSSDMDVVQQKIRDYGIVLPDHFSAEDFYSGFQKHRTQSVRDLVSSAELLGNIAVALFRIYESDNKQRLVFSIANLRRILGHAIRVTFEKRIRSDQADSDGPDPHRFKTRLYTLDRNTNLFRWSTHATEPDPLYVNPQHPPCESKDGTRQWNPCECTHVNELLRRVLREKNTIWATPVDGFAGNALGCYLPLKTTDGVVNGVLQVVFDPSERPHMLGIALHQDESLSRTAVLGTRVLARCMEAGESIEILGDELDIKAWLARAGNHVIEIRQQMESAGLNYAMDKFWYLCLLGLTHSDSLAFNRAGVYFIAEMAPPSQADGPRWYIEDAYGIGNSSRHDWTNSCNPVEALSDLQTRITQSASNCSRSKIPGSDTMVAGQIAYHESLFANCDHDTFSLGWMRPTQSFSDLILELHKKQTGSKRLACVEKPFAHFDTEQYPFSATESVGPGESPNYSVYLLHRHNCATGRVYTVLYVDDAWTALRESPKNMRARQLEALNHALLMPRFIEQTRIMLESIDSHRTAESGLFHSLAPVADNAYDAWRSIDDENPGRQSRHKREITCPDAVWATIGEFLRLMRNRTIKYSQARNARTQYEECQFSLNTLVHDMSRVCALPAYEVEIPAVDVRTRTDQGVVEFAISELVNNAKSNGKNVWLRLVVRDPSTPGTPWHIEVENSGQIPDHILPDMFVPGVSNSNSPGRGLGLGLVRSELLKADLKLDIGNVPEGRVRATISGVIC